MRTRKTKHMSVFTWLFTMILMTSCSGSDIGKNYYKTNTIEIQVLKPASLTIPAEVKSIGIVYFEPQNDSKPLKISKSSKEEIHENARKSCLNGLHKYINSAEMTDLSAAVLTREKEIFEADSDTINWERIKKFGEIHHIDAIILLPRMKINNTLLPGNYYSDYNKYSDLELKTTWTLLIPAREEKIEKDIIYKKLGQLNDDKDQFIYDAAESCGAKFGKELIPGWSKAYRTYFSDNNEGFKAATELIENGNWDEAAKVWENYLESDNARLAGKAHYNLALYYEIKGNLDKAFELAQTSEKTFSNPLAHEYAGKLYFRIKDQYRLAEQIGE